MKPTMRPASSLGLPSHEVSGIQAGISSAANKPVKKSASVRNAQGSHLARSQATDATPTSVVKDSSDTIMVYDPNSRKFVARPRTEAEQPKPPSPELPKAAVATPAPGTYDPNTRRIVPAAPNESSGVALKKTRPSLTPVETDVEPPPRNPARVSSQSSPVSPRAAGILSKQPSVVREDPEAEDAGAAAPSSSNYRSAQQHQQRVSSVPPRAYVASPSTKARSGSLDVPRSASSSDRGRGGSLSPSRSARFSAAPVIEGIRHEPHRGISPVKSAMKHSPASSVRTPSPLNSNASPVGGKTASETSEAPSLDALPKKKKAVRVSFDAAPQEIQPPSTPASSSVIRERSPVIDDDMDEIMKPRPALPSFGSVRRDRVQPEYAEKVTERPPDRNEASSDHAIGGILANDKAEALNTNEPLPPEVTSKDGPSYISDESEEETPAIKPQTIEMPAAQPALESKDDAPTADASTTSANEHVPQIGVQPPTPGEESVRKLGGMSPPASPKPKQEFSVPGGWAEEEADEEAVTAVVQPEAPEPKTIESLTTQPAPAISAAPPATLTSSHVEPPSHSAAANLSDITESDSDDSAAFSDAAEDLSDLDEGGFASLDAIVESPAMPSPAAAKKVTTPPDSPSARQAAKQQARGTDGSGDWSQATAYWSKLSRQQREQIEREHLSSDDEYRPQPLTTQRPKKKKSALKQPVAPVDPVAQPPQTSQQPATRARQTAATLQTQDAAPAAKMRKSMRGAQDPAPAPVNDGVQMRSSMRQGGSGGAMRTSMRGPPAQRPQSEVIAARSTTQRQNARPLSVDTASSNAAAGGAMLHYQASPKERSQESPFPKLVPQQAAQPPPKGSRFSKQQPVAKEDSDSESSFKKKRRPSASTIDTGGRYNMKRSMRAGSIDSEQARPISATPEKRKAFSVRSLSPTGSFFGRNRQTLKESMRAPPVDTGVKTLRGPNSMKAGSGKTMRNSAPARPATSSGNLTSKFKSRFADSDDEDDGGKPGGRTGGRPFFRSKFADSDDDEPGSSNFIAADLTPVRGIPKRQGQEDGDSTDLSDEDDDPRKASRNRQKQSAPLVPDPSDVEKAMEAARRNLGMTNGTTNTSAAQTNQGGALSKGSLRQSQQVPDNQETPSTPTAAETPRRRGFMGSILRRNKDSTTSVAQIPPSSPAAPAPAPPQTSTAVPARPMSPPGSPRGKLVRRSTAQSRLSRMDSDLSTAAPATDAPPVPTTDSSSNWPLAPPPKVTANGIRPASPTPGQGQDDRPMTSDGIHEQAVKLARTMRPDMGERSGSAHVGFAADAKMEDGDGGKAMYSARTGKKKKFGKLRRAFGLND